MRHSKRREQDQGPVVRLASIERGLRKRETRILELHYSKSEGGNVS